MSLQRQASNLKTQDTPFVGDLNLFEEEPMDTDNDGRVSFVIGGRVDLFGWVRSRSRSIRPSAFLPAQMNTRTTTTNDAIMLEEEKMGQHCLALLQLRFRSLERTRR